MKLRITLMNMIPFQSYKDDNETYTDWTMVAGLSPTVEVPVIPNVYNRWITGPDGQKLMVVYYITPGSIEVYEGNPPVVEVPCEFFHFEDGGKQFVPDWVLFENPPDWASDHAATEENQKAMMERLSAR